MRLICWLSVLKQVLVSTWQWVKFMKNGIMSLALAFGRVLREIQLGKQRRDALKDMADRMDVPDVNYISLPQLSNLNNLV